MLKNGSNPQNKVESLPFSFKWSEGIAPSPNLMILRHPLLNPAQQYHTARLQIYPALLHPSERNKTIQNHH